LGSRGAFNGVPWWRTNQRAAAKKPTCQRHSPSPPNPPKAHIERLSPQSLRLLQRGPPDRWAPRTLLKFCRSDRACVRFGLRPTAVVPLVVGDLSRMGWPEGLAESILQGTSGGSGSQGGGTREEEDRVAAALLQVRAWSAAGGKAGGQWRVRGCLDPLAASLRANAAVAIQSPTNDSHRDFPPEPPPTPTSDAARPARSSAAAAPRPPPPGLCGAPRPARPHARGAPGAPGSPAAGGPCGQEACPFQGACRRRRRLGRRWVPASDSVLGSGGAGGLHYEEPAALQGARAPAVPVGRGQHPRPHAGMVQPGALSAGSQQSDCGGGGIESWQHISSRSRRS